MSRRLGAIVLAMSVIALVGCATTTARIQSSWRDPQVTPNALEFKKLLVVAIMTDPEQRVRAEDELARRIMAGPRGQAGELTAVASHTLLVDDEMRDGDKVRARIEGLGFDGAVTMRLMSSEGKTSWSGGNFPEQYQNFWDYYRWGWSTVNALGYYRMDTAVLVESNVYSLPAGALIWAAISESYNPGSSRKLMAAVAQAVADELEKQGLITAAAPAG
jgi:hypothetical protein